MPDPGISTVLHAGTLLACVVGMGWLALAMDAHARQVWRRALAPAAARALRVLGAAALAGGLVLALAADHASMAVLVWVMAVAGAALAVAMILAWCPSWLRWLAPWVAPLRDTGRVVAGAGRGPRRSR